jgi:hypothetical protein
VSGPCRAVAAPGRPRPSSRSGVLSSVAITVPAASHSSCTVPNEDAGTRYENGRTIRVTRKRRPSGDGSTARIIAGAPTVRTLRSRTVMTASWPVVWYSSRAWSCGSSSRLACTGCGLGRSVEIRTCGPSAMPLWPRTGALARPAGSCTTTTCRPSAVNCRPVTSVASSGVRVSCVDRPVATSAMKTCEAVAKLAMYATWVPVGDHVSAERLAPCGVCSVRVRPVAGSTTTSPRLVLVVSERARWAAGSTCTPPR